MSSEVTGSREVTGSSENRTLWTGGRIFTSAEPAWAEALVVDGDRLAFVGSAVEAARVAGEDAEVVELAGRFVAPGFVDGHGHVLMTGEAEGRAHLASARDLAGIQRRVRDWADTHPGAPRVLGRSWLFAAVPDGRPTRQMLDEVVPDRPVYLDANDYHSVWVNSAALAELGVTRETADPVGGRIAREPGSGEPTGHLDETAVHSIVWPFLASVTTDEDRDRHLAAAVEAYTSTGVTGVVDMAMDADALAAMERADAAGTLAMRVVGHWLMDRPGTTADHLAQVAEAVRLAERWSPGRSPYLRMAGVKFIVDGVIDGCTAAMKAPYADGSNAEPIWDYDALAPVVAAADAAGLQIALHAIGDRAIGIALDALEHAVRANGPRVRRHRIEHLEYTDETDVPRLAVLGVTASMQPVHADPAVQENWRAMLGDFRVERGFPWPEFTDTGATLAFGTDAPTAPHPPLPNMYIAATRRSAVDPSLPPNVPRYALPLADALRHATLDAAWSCFEESARGSLEAGKLADFVVVDSDPFEAGLDALLTARVLRTVVGGREVYAAGPA
jgi:predicted amidohydrolase YtcJ